MWEHSLRIVELLNIITGIVLKYFDMTKRATCSKRRDFEQVYNRHGHMELKSIEAMLSVN
jgi:hypothetical protein